MRYAIRGEAICFVPTTPLVINRKEMIQMLSKEHTFPATTKSVKEAFSIAWVTRYLAHLSLGRILEVRVLDGLK